MSDVFISYARSDQAKARAVAEALRAEGFGVWLDDQLPTHRAYRTVIEEELRAAAAVVVLWSQAAAESSWVCAEADQALAMNKLVQATTDGVLPPMPFNQIQCAHLKGWRGANDHAEWRKALASVQALAGEARSKGRQAPAMPAAAKSGRSPGLGWLLAGGAAGLVLAGVAAAFLWLRPGAQAPSTATKVAVLPFRALGSNAAESSFAAALADEVSGELSDHALSTKASDASPAAEREAALEKMGAAFAVSGTVRTENGHLRVRAFLEDLDSRTVVWSRDFEEPLEREGFLRAEVGNSVLETVYSALQTLGQPGVRLDPQTLSLFLRGTFGSATALTPFAFAESRRAFEEVVKRQPRFGLGHSQLALSLANPRNAATPAQRAYVRSEAEAGIRISPHTAAPSYDALFHLARIETPGDLSAAEDILLRGIKADPDSPFLWMRLCDVALGAGRMAQAVDQCGRAGSLRASNGPIAWRMAQTAYYGGDIDLARQDFKSVVDRHPGYFQGQRQRLDFEAITGDPAIALAILNDPDQRPVILSPVALDAIRSFLEARQAKSGASRAVAASRLKSAYLSGKLAADAFVLYSGTLGYADDAFEALHSVEAEPAASGLLLHPALAGLRRDPRFWREAARVGLITYWRKRGIWPDFCSAPGETFDCQAAARRAQPA
jgi:TolB-like protein